MRLLLVFLTAVMSIQTYAQVGRCWDKAKNFHSVLGVSESDGNAMPTMDAKRDLTGIETVGKYDHLKSNAACKKGCEAGFLDESRKWLKKTYGTSCVHQNWDTLETSSYKMTDSQVRNGVLKHNYLYHKQGKYHYCGCSYTAKLTKTRTSNRQTSRVDLDREPGKDVAEESGGSTKRSEEVTTK